MHTNRLFSGGAEETLMPWAQAADDMPALLRCTDLSGRCGFVNHAWQEFTGLDRAQAHGLGWEAAVHPEDMAACRAGLTDALAEAQPFRLEYRLRRADGEWRWVIEAGRPLFRHGRLVHLLAQALDVTDARQASAYRSHMDAERDELVLELQHRVRNNAQATSSVLSLQAGRSHDPAVAAALRGAAARVLLATQVQDRIFRMTDSATVELGPEVIAAALAACDLAGQDRSRLDLRVELGIVVPVRQAAPLALIINELTTNALHHAFAPDSSGQVVVALRRIGRDQAELLVADEGIGLPQANTDGEDAHGAAGDGAAHAAAKGLGLDLAARLARQAGSALVTESAAAGTAGTRFCLRFAAADAAADLAGI